MASLRNGVLSLRFAFQAFRPITANKSPVIQGSDSSSTKLILTHSRCLFTKKSVTEVEAEKKAQKYEPGSLKNNYVPAGKGIFQMQKLTENYTSVIDVRDKIRDSPLNSSTIRFHLYGMLNVYKLHRSSPEFAEEAKVLILSDEFQRLAKVLEESLPMVSTRYLFVIFQVIHHYGIPYLSILSQKLHALILDNINNFDLTEVLDMYIIIREKNESILEPVKKALLEYLDHLATDNLKFLGNLKQITFFACNEAVPFSVRIKILRKILSMGKELKKLDPLLLMWLSTPLCSSEFQSLNKKDFLFALKERIPGDFMYRDLKVVLENLLSGIRNKVLVYDKDLFNLIAERAKKYGLWAANDIMSLLVSGNTQSFELARSIVVKCVDCDLKSQPKSRVAKLIFNFSSMDYGSYAKKQNDEEWKTVVAMLENYVNTEATIQQNISTALCLFNLGLNSNKTAPTALKEFTENAESYSKATKFTKRRAYLLYQYHCFVYKSPPKNLPKTFLRDSLAAVQEEIFTGWKETLYECFNGEDYVLHNCITPVGTLVSHIVIQGPDNKPINLSSYKKPQRGGSISIEDFIDIGKIERPADSKVLAFIERYRIALYFRNTGNFQMEPLITYKIHRNLGYRLIYLLMAPGESYNAKKMFFDLVSSKPHSFDTSETKNSSTADQSAS